MNTSTRESTLTDEERRHVDEVRTRDEFAQEVLGDPTFRDQITRLLEQIPLRPGRIDIPRLIKMEGRITVELAGKDLSDYFPEGAGFSFSEFEIIPDDPTQMAPQRNVSASPRFSIPTKEVQIPTSKEEGAKGRTFEKQSLAGLIVLHEIGHAIDEHKNRGFIKLLLIREQLNCYQFVSDKVKSDLERHLLSGSYETPHVTETFLASVKELIFQEVNRRVAEKSPEPVQETLKNWGENVPEFTDQLESFVSKQITEIIKNAVETARAHGEQEAISQASQTIEETIQDLQEVQRTAEKRFVVRGERAAWAHALRMARDLTRNHKAKLWKGSLAELFFEIERFINTHGMTGSSGVFHPVHRERLSLQEKPRKDLHEEVYE